MPEIKIKKISLKSPYYQKVRKARLDLLTATIKIMVWFRPWLMNGRTRENFVIHDILKELKRESIKLNHSSSSPAKINQLVKSLNRKRPLPILLWNEFNQAYRQRENCLFPSYPYPACFGWLAISLGISGLIMLLDDSRNDYLDDFNAKMVCFAATMALIISFIPMVSECAITHFQGTDPEPLLQLDRALLSQRELDTLYDRIRLCFFSKWTPDFNKQAYLSPMNRAQVIAILALVNQYNEDTPPKNLLGKIPFEIICEIIAQAVEIDLERSDHQLSI